MTVVGDVILVIFFFVAIIVFFFFQAEDGIRDIGVTGVQTCALPIYLYCIINHLALAANLFLKAVIIFIQ